MVEEDAAYRFGIADFAACYGRYGLLGGEADDLNILVIVSLHMVFCEVGEQVQVEVLSTEARRGVEAAQALYLAR